MMREAQQLMPLAEQHRLGPFRLFGSAFMGWALCMDGDPRKRNCDADEGRSTGWKASSFACLCLGTLRTWLRPSVLQGNLAESKENLRTRSDDDIRRTDLWIEAEVRRIDALVAADHERSQSAEKVEAKFREAIETRAKSGISDIRASQPVKLAEFPRPEPERLRD
jgi:hypothetical protein